MGQNHFPVISMEIISIPIPDTVNGQVDISDTTMFDASMKITIWDTVTISKLYVDLKKDHNGSLLFQQQFQFDNFSQFPNGSSYSRNGYEIILILGRFQGLINPYAELKVETTTGSVSDPIVFNQ
jgi:hypothetical protein